MQVISIVNLKGGVGKTTTAVNMAYELATTHNYRILLVDADHQGNASKFYSANAELGCLTDLIEGGTQEYSKVIQHTNYRNLDIIPSDMSLLSADVHSVVMQDGQPRMKCMSDLRDTVEEDGRYDCIVIDCPPAFTVASMSAIAASSHVIIPIKLDYYAIGGMQELISQIQGIQRITNVRMGALVTQWSNSEVVKQGEAWLHLQGHKLCPVYRTHIRRTEVVDKSTYWRRPLAECSPRSAATADYAAFVREFLEEGSHGTQV